MSLSPTNQNIVDLWDAGLSIEQIGERMGLTRARVAKGIERGGAGYDNGQATRDRAATARLAQAIHSYFERRIANDLC